MIVVIVNGVIVTIVVRSMGEAEKRRRFNVMGMRCLEEFLWSNMNGSSEE